MEPGDMAIQNNRHLQGQGSTLPIESGKADFIFIGRSRTPPLRDTIILLHTGKSVFICY